MSLGRISEGGPGTMTGSRKRRIAALPAAAAPALSTPAKRITKPNTAMPATDKTRFVEAKVPRQIRIRPTIPSMP